MSKPLKIILMITSGFVILLVFVAVALILFVAADTYKPQLEAATSRALGMDVRVGGQSSVLDLSKVSLPLGTYPLQPSALPKEVTQPVDGLVQVLH